MKTKDKQAIHAIEREKSIMQQLRDIRDKVSSEIQTLTYEQLMDYLHKQKTLHTSSTWRKALKHW